MEPGTQSESGNLVTHASQQAPVSPSPDRGTMEGIFPLPTGDIHSFSQTVEGLLDVGGRGGLRFRF